MEKRLLQVNPHIKRMIKARKLTIIRDNPYLS